MRVESVIPHKFWRHKATGRTASLYGAHPGTPGTYDDWEVITDGWTWRAIDERGRCTIGLCRPPVQSESLAHAIMEAFNKRDWDWLREHAPRYDRQGHTVTA